MPFELRIDDVSYGEGEVAIAGKVIAGAYFGPEVVLVPVVGAGERRSFVTHHSMSGSLGWPLEPPHDAHLTLGVHWHDPPPRLWRPGAARIDTRRPLVGVGVVQDADRRVDASDELGDPRLWGLVLYDLLERCEDGDPDLQAELLGNDLGVLTAWHAERVERPLHQGIWPYVRLPLGSDRWLELELAGGVERQNRYRVGVGARSALAGYHSGHFSLPAFRLEEALRTGAHLPPGAAAAVKTLMLTGCWVREATPAVVEAVASALRGLPGARAAAVAQAAGVVAERLVVPDGPAWSHDPVRGWVNDGVYSQRNPASKLSVLGDEGFARIRAFFEGPG